MRQTRKGKAAESDAGGGRAEASARGDRGQDLAAPGAALLLVGGTGKVLRSAGWREVAGAEAPEALPAAGESPDGLVDAVVATVEEARRLRGLARRFVEVTTERRRYFAIAAAPAAHRGGDPGATATLVSDISGAFSVSPKEGQAIRDLGHDLRTPLTSLSGAVELLQSGRMGTLTAEQDKLLGMMQQGLQLMLTLIEDATAPYRPATGTGNGEPGRPRAAAS